MGDVNGDSKLDLIETNPFANTVSVLLGNGDGTFQAKADYPTGNILPTPTTPPHAPLAVELRDVGEHTSFEKYATLIATFIASMVTLSGVLATGYIAVKNTVKQINGQTQNIQNQQVAQAKNQRKLIKENDEKRRIALVQAIAFQCLRIAVRAGRWSEHCSGLSKEDQFTSDDIEKMRIIVNQSLDVNWNDAALLDNAIAYTRLNLVFDYAIRGNRRIDFILSHFEDGANQVNNSPEIREKLDELSDFWKSCNKFSQATADYIKKQFSDLGEFVLNTNDLLVNTRPDNHEPDKSEPDNHKIRFIEIDTGSVRRPRGNPSLPSE